MKTIKSVEAAKSMKTKGFAFAEALVMIMFVGTLMMPMMGSLTNNATRITDMRHKRLADAHAQTVQATILASAPYRQQPSGFSRDFSLDETSTNTVTVTFQPLTGLSNFSTVPALLATPTFYSYRIDVERFSTDSLLESPASMAFLTGLAHARPINTKDPPIYVVDKVNFKILIVTIDDSSGVPVGTIADEILFNKGADCGALSGQAVSTNYIEHCPGEMAVHPSGKWLFGAGSQFAWVIDVDPTSPYYKQEIWHRNPEPNADGTNLDELIGIGNSNEGSHLALSPCGKYFHVMTNCNCIYHYTFDATTIPPTVTPLYKNHETDTSLWADENKGAAYSRTGMLALTSQVSANSGAGTANTWFGDPRYIFAGGAGGRPVAAIPSRWQKLKIDSGHVDGSGFTFSHDGRYIYRHPDGCDSGWGGYELDLALSTANARLSAVLNTDNWSRLSLSADGRVMFAPRYEGTNPSFHWYFTRPTANLLALNTVNQSATAKNSGWATTSGSGKFFVLLKPMENSNNDEIHFVDIASLTTLAPPYNTDPPPVPYLAIGNRDPSGATSRWVERLIVGCSNAGIHKAFVLDMGNQTVYKEINLAIKPDYAGADPTGCHAIVASNTSSNQVVTAINGILATTGPLLPDGHVNSIKGGDWAVVTASNGVTLRHFLTGHATYDFLRAPIGADFLGLSSCEGTFRDSALRPIYRNTPTISNLLTVTFFDDKNLNSNAAFSKTDPPNLTPSNHPMNSTFPTYFSNDGVWSARWNGQIKAGGASGVHSFRCQNEDGVRMWINDTRVLDYWVGNTGGQNTDGSHYMVANQKYDVTLEWLVDGSVNSSFVLQWDPAGGAAFVNIPAANLFSATASQPAVFSVLDVQSATKPGGIAYFNGSDTHVFPYYPQAFDFPASPGYSIGITPDDGILAVYCPGVYPRRIDLYDINRNISAANPGIKQHVFVHDGGEVNFRRGVFQSVEHRKAAIKMPSDTSSCNGVAADCAQCLIQDWPSSCAGAPWVIDTTWSGPTTRFLFGRQYYKPPTNKTVGFRVSSDDGFRFSLDESSPLDTWGSGFPLKSHYHSELYNVAAITDPAAARMARTKRLALEQYDWSSPSKGALWLDFIESGVGDWTAAVGTKGNTFLPATNSSDIVVSYTNYNPPRFIRSIPIRFNGGALTPTAATAAAGNGSDTIKFYMNPNGESLTVLDTSNKYVGEFNLYDTGSWSLALPSGGTPVDVALSPDGERIYVADSTANNVVTIENSHYLPTANNRKIVATISLSLKPISLAQGECRDRIQHGRSALVSGPTWTTRRLVDGEAYKDRLYSFCGTTDGTNGLTTVEYLDIPTGNVVAQTAIVGQRMSHNVVLFDNKFWVLGGWHSSNNLNSVEIFDPETNSRSAGPIMTKFRAMGGAATDGDAIYYFGGLGGTTAVATTYQSDLEMYVAGRWVPVPTTGTTPTGRMHTVMLYYNQALWLIGGCTDYTVPTCMTQVSKLDLRTLSWSTSTALPAARGYHKGVVVGNRAIIFGGRSGATFYDSVLSLNLDNPSEGWTTIGTMPQARGGQAIGSFGGRIYSAQGYNSGGLISTTEYFTP